MYVLVAIAVLAVLIVVHEAGHFLAARLQGIYANRFSVGFGPILLKYQGPQTEYAIRAFPLGGFVGFPDDDPESEILPDDPNLLRNRPILDRAIVISAGVIANLIFAYCVLVAQLGIVGVPSGSNYEPGVIVPQIIGDVSPAAQAGIKAGDIILKADDLNLGAELEAVQLLVDKISSSPAQPIQILVQRDNQELYLTVVPELTEQGDGRVGVQLMANGKTIYRRPNSLLEILGLAGQEFQRIFNRTLEGFYRLVTDFRSIAPQIAGPVRIVEEGAHLAEADSDNLYFFAALISINLAIINILPLPALDGGQLAFLFIEGLRGQPLPLRLQEGVMKTGLMLLLGLGIFLIIRDTIQLDWLQNLFQQ